MTQEQPPRTTRAQRKLADGASYQARVRLAPAAGSGTGAPPTLPELEGALESALRVRFPDFDPTVRAERLDRD